MYYYFITCNNIFSQMALICFCKRYLELLNKCAGINKYNTWVNIGPKILKVDFFFKILTSIINNRICFSQNYLVTSQTCSRRAAGRPGWRSADSVCAAWAAPYQTVWSWTRSHPGRWSVCVKFKTLFWIKGRLHRSAYGKDLQCYEFIRSIKLMVAFCLSRLHLLWR